MKFSMTRQEKCDLLIYNVSTHLDPEWIPSCIRYFAYKMYKSLNIQPNSVRVRNINKSNFIWKWIKKKKNSHKLQNMIGHILYLKSKKATSMSQNSM
jgi:hypothetical protein